MSGLTPSWTFWGTIQAGAACADAAAVAREGADVVAAIKSEDFAVGVHAAHFLALAFIVCQIGTHGVAVTTPNLEAVVAA